MERLYEKYGLVDFKQLIAKAKKEKFCILHINCINYDWIKTALVAAQEAKSPIILAVSDSALKYFGTHKSYLELIHSAIKANHITIPVVAHLDHGSYESALSAIKAGFNLVMFDGSHMPFEENYQKTKEVVALADQYGCCIEAEVGPIGGKEDNIDGGDGELADVNECEKISKLGITLLAAGIGNIHGIYPPNWKGLRFDRLTEIHNRLNQMPLVLHGGTGIPTDQIKKAISLGVYKLNVGTETLVVYSKALNEYFSKQYPQLKKNYDPRKYMVEPINALKACIIEKIKLCGSDNKA
ncbi:MAG: class II fructose-bisphosphate aldolase family protein [Mycoplasma sp.]